MPTYKLKPKPHDWRKLPDPHPSGDVEEKITPAGFLLSAVPDNRGGYNWFVHKRRDQMFDEGNAETIEKAKAAAEHAADQITAGRTKCVRSKCDRYAASKNAKLCGVHAETIPAPHRKPADDTLDEADRALEYIFEGLSTYSA